jgi:hypothetical protein
MNGDPVFDHAMMETKYTKETEVLFHEQQRFSRSWSLLFVAGIALLGLLVMLDHRSTDDANKDLFILWLVGMILLMAMLLFLVMRLDTQVRTDGIHVRFFPFQWSHERFTWDRLKSAHVRRYSPIMEYGGWGLRLGMFGKGKAYTVSGDQGMQLIFHNGDRLLIGTQLPERLSEVLQSIPQLKH